MRPPARRILLLALIFAMALAEWTLIVGPSSTEIRLDTGDLRYCIIGIPFEYQRMPEPQRSRLLELSRRSNILRPTWHQCARFPLPSTNHTDTMCQGFYWRVVPWMDEDPQLALCMAEDIAEYIKKTNARTGLPDCVVMFSYMDGGGDQLSIRPNWRNEDHAQFYLESKRISTVPATHPIP